MAGRVYRLPFNAQSLSTSKQDLWAITTTSASMGFLEEVRLDPCATSISEFSLSLSLFTGSYTAGSGGAALTPAKTIPGDAAATVTCKTQNTTQTAVGSGTKTVLDAGQWNLANGWAWQPLDPDHRILVPISACLVVSLDSTPSSQTVSGCAIFREVF
ncbi:MAG TPA: hypothetical protein VKW08_15030 [Xanthobacteraceae bacterium]|jgi:hypothetical protein|nr:hypothetical protein [Xanthobacteraceae bacterium]